MSAHRPPCTSLHIAYVQLATAALRLAAALAPLWVHHGGVSWP